MSTSAKTIVLRPVTPENASTTLPCVLSLVRDLAVYEKEPLSSVEATVESLHESFFGNGGLGSGFAKCVLAYAYDGESAEEEAAAASGGQSCSAVVLKLEVQFF